MPKEKKNKPLAILAQFSKLCLSAPLKFRNYHDVCLLCYREMRRKKMKKGFIELKLFHCWANSIYHPPPDLTPRKKCNASAFKM